MGATCCSENNPNRKSFFTLSKLSFLSEGHIDQLRLDLPSDLYIELQTSLYHHWTNIPKDEKTLRYLIRKGIPERLFSKILQQLYPLTSSFLTYYNLFILNNEIPNFTPTFTSHLTIEAAVPKQYLTEAGLKALQSILWILNYKFPNINYSPLTTGFCSLILLYASESRSFEITDYLLTTSAEKRELLEKYFTTEAEQFKILVGVTCSVVYSEVQGLQSLMTARKIDFPKAISDLFKVFFIGYFKIGFLQRLLSMFLADGLLALVKIAVGVFKTVSDALSEFKREFSLELRSFCYTLDDDDPIFAAAQKVKITKNLFQDLEVPSLSGLTSYKYVRPKFDFSSKIISVCELESIWSHIPDYLRHCEIKLIYSTTNSGYSLKNLIRVCSSVQKQKATILLVKSLSHEVVGAFFENPVEVCSKYVGNYSSFVFTLKPLPCFYKSSGANEMHAFVSESVILLGGGKDGIALTIDQELLQACSSRCDTYRSPVLVAENFEVVELEVLSLTSL